jgi:hypothetical protein
MLLNESDLRLKEELVATVKALDVEIQGAEAAYNYAFRTTRYSATEEDKIGLDNLEKCLSELKKKKEALSSNEDTQVMLIKQQLENLVTNKLGSFSDLHIMARVASEVAKTLEDGLLPEITPVIDQVYSTYMRTSNSPAIAKADAEALMVRRAALIEAGFSPADAHDIVVAYAGRPSTSGLKLSR